MSGMEIKWPNLGFPSTPQMNRAKKKLETTADLLGCYCVLPCASAQCFAKFSPPSQSLCRAAWQIITWNCRHTETDLPPGAIHYQAFTFH